MQNILPIRKQLKFAIVRLILVLQDPMYINVEFIFVAVVGSPLVILIRGKRNRSGWSGFGRITFQYNCIYTYIYRKRSKYTSLKK